MRRFFTKRRKNRQCPEVMEFSDRAETERSEVAVTRCATEKHIGLEWMVLRVKDLTRFGKENSGAVSILFSIGLGVIVLSTGMAIDYSKSVDARAKIFQALDSAVLAAASIPGSPGATSPSSAQTDAFNTMMQAQLKQLRNVASYTGALSIDSTGAFVGVTTANIRLNFSRIVGLSTVPLTLRSAVNPSISPSVEIAMALDVSGSMLNTDLSGVSRIDALKAAAQNLVDQVSATVKSPSTVKVGYVPFTMNVNIGTANSAYVTGATDPLFTGTQWAGCVLERPVPEHISNAYDGSVAGSKGRWNAYIYPPEPNGAGAGPTCTVPSNGTPSGYASVAPYVATDPNPFTTGPNFNCVRYPMQPLSTTLTTVKSGIGSLTANGNYGTMFGLGVTWAMRLLTPNAPFPGADAPGSTRKVIIALTDGEQTTEAIYAGNNISGCKSAQNSTTPYNFSPATLKLSGKTISTNGPVDNFSAYGYLYDSDPLGMNYTSINDVDASLNPLALSACNYVKSNTNIEIFTIAVSSAAGPGTTVYNTLKSCASADDHFFLVTDYAGMINAFAEIGKQATRLRIVR